MAAKKPKKLLTKTENPIKKKNAPGQGRKSDYDPKYCDMLIEYFSVPPYIKDGDAFVTSDVPTLSGFAIKIGVHRGTLNNWAREFPEFGEACELAKDYFENFMVILGNRGLVNPTFANLTMKNIGNWREKQPGEEDRTVTLQGGQKPVQVERTDLLERINLIKGKE